MEVIRSNSNLQLNMCFQRKQKDVSKENEFYMQLLQQALPLEQQQTQQPLPQQQQQQSCQNTSPEKSRGKTFICYNRQLSDSQIGKTISGFPRIIIVSYCTVKICYELI